MKTIASEENIGVEGSATLTQADGNHMIAIKKNNQRYMLCMFPFKTLIQILQNKKFLKGRELCSNETIQ